jgi:hypothetical protein
MNKEQLEKKIVELEKQKDQMIANVNFCAGSIEAYKKMIISLEVKKDVPNNVDASSTPKPD